MLNKDVRHQGSVVQSIVSLTSSLVVKMLTVLVSTISNSQVFLVKCKCKSYSHFFSKNISIYVILNDQSFNDTLTNDIVSFEQLGPDVAFCGVLIVPRQFAQDCLSEYLDKYSKHCPIVLAIK